MQGANRPKKPGRALKDMWLLAFELILLVSLTYFAGIAGGATAHWAVERATRARFAPAPAAAGPAEEAFDVAAEIEETLSAFETGEPDLGVPDLASPPVPETSSTEEILKTKLGQIPDPAPPAQVKFEKLLYEARKARGLIRDDEDNK